MKPLLVILFILFFSGEQQKEKSVKLSGFNDLDSVTVFAAKLAIKGNTFKGSFSANYNRFYFFRKKADNTENYELYYSDYLNNNWQSPIRIKFSEEQSDTYPLLIPGTDALLFLSNRRLPTDQSEKPNYNFWFSRYLENKWSEPQPLLPNDLIYNYNSQPSINLNGDIYFTSDLPDWSKTHSYKASNDKTEYKSPVMFASINKLRETNPDWKIYEFAMAPDDSYYIVVIEKEKNVNLYLSKYQNGNWTDPVALSDRINTIETENFPYITLDGKFLLFTRAFSSFHIVPTKLFLINE